MCQKAKTALRSADTYFRGVATRSGPLAAHFAPTLEEISQHSDNSSSIDLGLRILKSLVVFFAFSSVYLLFK